MNDLISWLRPILTEEESDANGLIEAVAEARSRGLPSTIWDEQEAGARRALRQVQAHRAILDDYERAFESRKRHRDDMAIAGALLALHGAVKRLLSIYSDRDGYNPEWSA